MNRRVRLQLRLQETVEFLSIAAIVYYVAGLVGYVARGLEARGADINPDVVVAISVPVIAVVAIAVAHQLRRRILASHRSGDAAP
jgi:uncharacterized membrane-anchored protein